MILTTLAPTGENSETRRIQSIDGLRAVAVLAVMGYHFGVGPTGGFLGVDLFFVISGFVITRLLLRQQRTGTLTMGRFYAHRVRRLMPALLCVLFTVQLWVWLAELPAMRNTVNSQALAALGFFGNWYTIFADVDYWSVQPAETPLNHLWSLAVEEQFYLVWPALVVLLVAQGRGPRTLTFVTGAGAVLSYTLAAWNYVPGLPDRAYLGTDTRAGALCLGALAASAVATAASGTPMSRTPRSALPLLAVVSGGVLLALWSHAAIDSTALYVWQLPVAGLAAATLITVLAMLENQKRPDFTHHLPTAAILKIVAARPVVAVGTISYGLYLWHWPLWVYINHTFPQWGPSAHQFVAVVSSFTFAYLSYLFIESPARRCKLRPLLFSVISASVVVSSFILISTPPPQQGSDGDGPVVSGVR